MRGIPRAWRAATPKVLFPGGTGKRRTLRQPEPRDVPLRGRGDLAMRDAAFQYLDARQLEKSPGICLPVTGTLRECDASW